MEPNEENINHAVYIATLIRRLHEKEILSAAEEEVLMQWQQEDGNQQLLNELQDRQAVTTELRQLKAYDSKGAVKGIFNQLGIAVPARVRKMNPFLRWSSVAAVVLICLTATRFFIQRGGRTMPAPKFSHTGGALTPGSNKATLTLADGSTIILDSTHNGHLAFQGKTNIVKTDGQLTYKGTGAAKTLFNSISTPRGGQYAVTLADGTKIWLNAASTLKYPTAFTGSSRSVELTGEAYFEVAGDKSKPFTVRLNVMDVQVLGTRFNIKAYQDDASIKTTLLDGAVRLTAPGTREALLKPGQQGEWSQQQSRFMVWNVNTNNEVAWRNGYFAFDNENIHDIMKDLSRWYDIDVEFRNNSMEKKFGGTVSRYQNAEEVLEVLELTGSVHFSIKDKKIIVMP